MELEALLHTENIALSAFVAQLGFDPAKVIAEVSDPTNSNVKNAALAALHVDRDFSGSVLSPDDIEAANKLLDRLTKNMDSNVRRALTGTAPRSGSRCSS